MDCDKFLKVAESVGTEADQQRLVTIDFHLPARRLHVNEPAECRVRPQHLKRRWNEATVCQHHLVLMNSLGEDCAGIEGVERQLEVWW